jgi:hypothetical protein
VSPIKDKLAMVLLDMLVDGPSSFASIYGSLLQTEPLLCRDVGELFSSALENEKNSRLRLSQMAGDGTFHPASQEEVMRDLRAYEEWLPRATFSELSIDEIGLWLEITPKGWAEWQEWSSSEDRNSQI